VLGAILALHNHHHSAKDKDVSIKTIFNRQRFLAAFYRELRHETRFRDADPRRLSNRHIFAMVQRWQQRYMETATIHNYLSMLRTLAGWTGKPGLVRPPEHYVGADSPHAHRHQDARQDQSWTAQGIDIEAKIAEVAAIDAYAGLQLELCYRFGMRPKEARHFRPHEAILPRADAATRDTDPFPEVAEFVRIEHGTKGGRVRDVPLVTPEQRDLIHRLKDIIPLDAYVGRPGYTAEQNNNHFYYVMRKTGISKQGLGVVAHGLRHQFANDAFEADSGAPSPVRGGHCDTDKDAVARERTARRLGHSRTRVATCYLGSSAVMRSKARKAPPP
jgi:integrase